MQSSPDPEHRQSAAGQNAPPADPLAVDQTATSEDSIELQRSDRAWQRQIDAEEADRTRGSLYNAATLRWLILAIVATCLALLLMQRLQWMG